MTLPRLSCVSPACRKRFLQKRLFRSRSGAGRQREPDVLPRPGAPTTRDIPLGVIRFPDQTRLWLLVSEHAAAYCLASVEDSHHRRTGFCIIEAYFVHLAVCSLGSSVFSLRSDEKSRFSNFCVWRVGSSWCWCLQLWFWEPLFFLKEWWEISLLQHQANVDSRQAISWTSLFNKFHRLELPFSVRSDQKSRSWSTRRMVIQAELFRWQGVNNNFNSLVFEQRQPEMLHAGAGLPVGPGPKIVIF